MTLAITVLPINLRLVAQLRARDQHLSEPAKPFAPHLPRRNDRHCDA